MTDRIIVQSYGRVVVQPRNLSGKALLATLLATCLVVNNLIGLVPLGSVYSAGFRFGIRHTQHRT